jgi:hypothetical protein
VIAALLERLLGPKLSARISPWLVLVALLGSGYVLAGIFHAQSPLQDWLFWRYLGVWVGATAFAAASISVGNLIVRRLSEDEEPASGHFTLSFATGVFAFFLLTAAVGFLHGFGKVTFVLIPCALFAVGFKQLRRDVALLRERARDGRWLSLTPFEVAAFAVGLLGLVVIYLGVLVPDNASYDARWYHVAVAEHYAAAGGIIRSVEGNVTVTVPQLASVLDSWAFCMPGGGLFEHYELAAHLELVMLLGTLPGVVALVRYLVPGVRARWAWLAMLAFPSLFVYDSSLHGGADHVAALFAIPAYLSMIRAWKELRLRACLLLAISVSGLLMSKYTAAAAAAGPVLAITLRGLWLTVGQLRARPRRPSALYGLLATLGAGLALTTPHWLKNLIWYGDPLYPMLHHYLKVRPWNGDGDFFFAVYQEQQFVPTGSLSHKLLGMLKALYDHSYALYNWSDFHGNYPVFGSLFTFSLVALPFLRGTRRTWGLVLLTHLGVIVWYWVSDAERYLQCLLPWMAASVASIGILAWRSGWPARVGVVGLTGLQLVWGSDMVFWPLHRMTGKSPIGMANDFFARGYGKGGESRSKPFEDFAALGRGLPPRSKVVVHHEHLHLGLGTMVVSDSTRMAYGINYGELGSPAAVHALFRSYGVTHVVWEPRAVYGDESVAGDLVFHTYAASWTTVGRSGSRHIASLPSQPPEPREATAFVFSCDGSYPSGLYPLSALRLSTYSLRGKTTRYPKPQVPYTVGDAVPRAGYAVINEGCASAPRLKGYGLVATSGSIRYYAAR